MNCKDCQALIPNYVDGELSEAQAAPLRQHLLDCRDCRKTLLGEKSFKRWFEPELAIDVPVGFAQRVARRAFAGDEGLPEGGNYAAAGAEEKPLLQFVLRATAIAAALLLVVSVMTFDSELPEGSNVKAGKVLGMEELIEGLDKLGDPAVSQGTQAEEGAIKDMSEETEKDEMKAESANN
ncbi:MAG: hypothetical protein ACI8X5_002941 [Planctomycetota bacterium]|jgi:hypothetical protein